MLKGLSREPLCKGVPGARPRESRLCPLEPLETRLYAGVGEERLLDGGSRRCGAVASGKDAA